MLRSCFKKTLFAILIFNIVISTACCSLHDPDPINGYEYEHPTLQVALDDFSDEKVVILYRGIHFLEDQFTSQECLDFVNSEQVGLGLFSSASYELADIPYDWDDPELLTEHSGQICDEVNILYDTEAITIGTRQFSSQRYAFQHLYSNDYKSFHKQLSEPEGDYSEVFDNFTFTRNPLVSFSDRIRHPCKYGFGLKNYGNARPRLPRYNIAGLPQNPFLGKMYGVILDEAAVEELLPLNVAKAHHSNELTLSTHFRNDILSEREISIAGYIPGDYVVFEMPLQAPSFNHEYYPYYEQKYGLTKRRFNNFKKVFTSATKTRTEKDKKSRALLQGIIEAERQDDSLIYKNCIAPRIKEMFFKELTRIGARECSLELDRTLTPINP